MINKLSTLFPILTILTLLTGCSLAPFSATTSGRTVGAGKMKAEVGNSNSSYFIKFALGASEDFDAGFVMEFGDIATSAIFFKYSMLNNELGPSLSTDFGYGSTETTRFYYIGATGSVAFTKELEFFMSARLNDVSTDETDVEKGKENGNLTINAYNLKYLQFTYGMNVWISENVGLSVYSTVFRGEDIETTSDSTFGASLMLQF